MTKSAVIWGDVKIAEYLGWGRSLFLRSIADDGGVAWLRSVVRYCPTRKRRYVLKSEMDEALRNNPNLADLAK